MIKPQFKTFIKGEKVYRNEGLGTITSEEQLANLIAEEGATIELGGSSEEEGDEIIDDSLISQEEALKLMQEEGGSSEEKKGGEDDSKEGSEKKEEEGSADTGEENKDENKEDETDEPKETDPLVFLNNKYNLNLKPENFNGLSDEERTEAIGEIFETFISQAQQGLASLKEAKEIMDTDAEVKQFIAAKAQGKTMKDFVSEFASTPEGALADDLVRSMLKRNSVLDDEAIEDSIKSLKEKGKFDEVADKARELAKQEEMAALQEAEDRKKEALDNYNGFLQSQEKIMGLKLTDELKARLYDTISVVDENGMNALGKALQSEENILKASIAIFALDEVVEKLSTNKGNQKKYSMLEKLAKDPAELQGDSVEKKPAKTKKDEDFIALANSF